MNEYPSWADLEIERLRRDDRIREAEQYYQASIEMRIEPDTDSLVSRLFYLIGDTLSTFGASLKERFQRDTEPTPCPAVDCQ